MSKTSRTFTQSLIVATMAVAASSTLRAQAINVSLSPSTATVSVGQTFQFTAKVTPGSKSGVTWNVNGITGGNATVGTISTSGLYTAPNVLPSPPSVTVSVISTADSSGSASATVTVGSTGPSVAVSPSASSLQLYQTQQFAATVSGLSNTGVTWSVNGVAGGDSINGTISTGGLYTAPAVIPVSIVTVAASSVADSSKSGQAAVTVIAPTLTISPSATAVLASQSTQFSVVQSGSKKPATYTWSVNGIKGGNSVVGTISNKGVYTAPGMPPSPAKTTIIATSTNQSGLASATILPAVSVTVSPASASVIVSQMQQFTATVGGTSNTAVSWSVNGITGGNSTVGTVSSSGLYSAPATVPSPASVTVTVTSAADTTKSAGATATVSAPTPTPTITTSSLPNGKTGVAYNATLAATGGTTPYTWSILSGQLPAGVSLGTTTGIISGTPSTAGTYNITVQLSDATGQIASTSLALLIAASLSITSTTVPNGTVGIAYNATLTSSGGTAPVTWAVSSGQLPAGLSLSPAGSITGTPSTAASYTFVAQATDSAAATASKSYTAIVSTSTTGGGTITITNADLPNGTVGSAYAATLSATGGASPYTWSVSSGALPAGLTLDSSSGAISGMPTAVGWSNLFTVQVSDSAASTASLPYSVIISPVLDVYGGLQNHACSGTGWFHAQKINGRWWLCDPSGNVFFFQGVGAMVPGGSGSDSTAGQSYNLDNILSQKYGDENYTWGPAQNRRLLSWGFNGVGQLSTGVVEPMSTCSACGWPGGTQPVKLATVNTLTVSNYAGVNLWNYASGATKNMTFGMNGNYRAWPASVMDFYDPAYGQWLDKYFATDTGFQSFAASPWTVGLFIDDTDWFWGMGAGPDFSTIPPGHTNANSAYMVLITSPVQTFNPNPSYGGISVFYNDPKVYSKTGMTSPPTTCSITTPCSLRTYLSKKYGTVSALNSAWGSNYTTFDSTGTTVASEGCGTGDGSTTVFTCTLGHNPISPLSVSVSVGGMVAGADCPWFKSACNITGASSAPYSCGAVGACVGSFGGTSGAAIAAGGPIPWAGDYQLSATDCGGCGLPQASYWFRIAWHGPAGCGGAMSREIGSTLTSGSPQVSVATQNTAGDMPSCATGVDIYVSCRVTNGSASHGCASAGSAQPAETLQQSNVPYPSGSWTEPITGLVSGAPLPNPPSSIDYGTGQVQLTFTSAPANGAPITLAYTYKGWMFGTGLMDEDGRNGSWLGTNPYCLQPASSCNGTDNAVANANATVAADLDGWITQFAGEYFSTIRTNLKKYAPNLMYLGADTVGTWGVPARKEILQAAGQYVDALFVNMFPGMPDTATYSAMYQYLTQYLGDKPLMLFLTAHGTPDSSLFRYDASAQVIGFSKQEDRGQAYSDYLSSMLSTASYNGTYPWVGISWWGLYDFWNEKTNWGLVSLNDNPYDGKSSCQTARTDQWGYATGGEAIVPSWQPGTTYAPPPAPNAAIQVSVNGSILVFSPSIAGVSGSTPPAWPAALGAPIADGTVTWRNIGTKDSAACFGNAIDSVKAGNTLWYGKASQ